MVQMSEGVNVGTFIQVKLHASQRSQRVYVKCTIRQTDKAHTTWPQKALTFNSKNFLSEKQVRCFFLYFVVIKIVCFFFMEKYSCGYS